jgi:hypothetical protein
MAEAIAGRLPAPRNCAELEAMRRVYKKAVSLVHTLAAAGVREEARQHADMLKIMLPSYQWAHIVTAEQLAPVEAPIEAPVEAPIEAPVEAPIEAPVEAPIMAEPLVVEPRPVAPNCTLTLDAATANSLDEVQDAGVLYYIPQLSEFAINICGEVWHGNIGTIAAAKSCDIASNKAVAPIFHPNSWSYEPAIAQKRIPHARHFGSADQLEVDLLALAGGRELQLRSGQLMHDLLCALLLKQKEAL